MVWMKHEKFAVCLMWPGAETYFQQKQEEGGQVATKRIEDGAATA